MTHTRWRSGGHPTGLVNKGLLPLLPLLRGLMGMPRQEYGNASQRNSVQFMS